LGNRNPTKHYSQETKELATGILQNTIHRKLKNGQQEPYKTLHRKLKNAQQEPYKTKHRKLKIGQQEPYKTLYTGN
jgi:hypothetical protein